MIAVLLRQRMQQSDRHAIEHCRVPSLVLLKGSRALVGAPGELPVGDAIPEVLAGLAQLSVPVPV
jgi:hypothetical protein